MVISVITDYSPELVERLRISLSGVANLQNTICYPNHQEHSYYVERARLKEAVARTGAVAWAAAGGKSSSMSAARTIASRAQHARRISDSLNATPRSYR